MRRAELAALLLVLIGGFAGASAGLATASLLAEADVQVEETGFGVAEVVCPDDPVKPDCPPGRVLYRILGVAWPPLTVSAFLGFAAGAGLTLVLTGVLMTSPRPGRNG